MSEMTVPPLFSRRRRARGFTLIELVVVLAIVAILLRVATPGMSRSVAARAMNAQSSEFMAALRFARSEALTRGTAVTVCAALPGVPPGCQGARATDWRSGWIVFADRERRGRPDAHDPLLRIQPPLLRTGGVAGSRGSISFTAAGFSTDASSHYLFNPPAGAIDPPPGVMVCVSKQGRPRLAGGAACD